MQPQITYRQGAERGPARTASVLALIVASAVVLGWYLPYWSSGGESASLSDAPGNADIAVLIPSVVAVIGSILGLRGQRFGAAIAAGAAATVATWCFISVAAAYEVVDSADDFGGFIDINYSVGWYLHVLAGMAALVVVFVSFAVLQESAVREHRSVNPAVVTIGGIAVAASALGFLLPDNGVSVFDIDSTPIKATYLLYVAVLAFVGIAGFASGRPSGAALGAGAALTPLMIWFADATNDQEFGDGFFGGLTDGNIALVAVGAAVAVVLGIVGMVNGMPRGAGAVPPAQSFEHSARAVGSSTMPFDTRLNAVWTSEGATMAHSWDSGVAEPLLTAAPVRPEPVQPVPVETVAPAVPAGWHPDPLGRHEQRYWDGTRWTSHVSNGGSVESDPV